MNATARRPTDQRSHVKLRDRYNLANAHSPAGVGSPPRSRNAATVLVAIEDPIADPHTGRKGRLLATVNRKVDILELERSHGRISDEAYCAGRIAQAIWEKATRATGGGQWMQGSRVDAELAKEIAIIRNIDNARTIEGHMAAMRALLGGYDADVVHDVLRDGMTYVEAALARGRAGRIGTAYIAQRFRDALEVLGEARGRRDRNG